MRSKRFKSVVATAAISTLALVGCASQGPEETPGSEQISEGTDSDARSLAATPEFRQALKLAIDMEGIIDGIMDGKADAANAVMAPGPFKPEGLEDWSYDPDAAKALLEGIGWDESVNLDLVYYYGDQATVDFMAAVQQYLSQVGVQVTPRKLEGDLATQLWTSPGDKVNGPSAVDWDIAYAAVAALSPHEYYDRFLSTYPGNSYWALDDEFETLIDATAATADVDEQIAAFHSVVEWDNENLPSVPLYYQPIFVVESDALDRAGHELGNEQYNYEWGIADWSVEPNGSGDQVLYTNGGAVDFFETPFVNPGLHLSTKVLYDHLIVASPDLAEFSPQLAESYDVSDDGKQITLTMRSDITWHDGEAITAEDAKFTLELAANVSGLHAVFDSTMAKLEGSDEFRAGDADDISGITIDGDTLTLTFEEVDPNALMTLSQLPPLPKHLLSDADPLQIQQDAFFQAPVGSGPFKIEDVRMGDYTVFEKFEDYWNGEPELDRIEMYPSGESDENLVKNVQAGSVDYAYTKSIDDAAAIENVDGMSVTSVDVMYTRLFFVNTFPQP